MSEQHCNTIASIVFSSHYISLANTVPVERSVEQSLREVSVRIEVGPLALSLETGGYRIMSKGLFLESKFSQFGITGHQVTHDYSLLDNEFPVFVFLFASLYLFRNIIVMAFVLLAVFLCPCHSLFKLIFVIDTLCHATDNFSKVYRLASHAQIFLKEIGVDYRTCNTHRDTTH